jgi:hypothetical protein
MPSRRDPHVVALTQHPALLARHQPHPALDDLERRCPDVSCSASRTPPRSASSVGLSAAPVPRTRVSGARPAGAAAARSSNVGTAVARFCTWVFSRSLLLCAWVIGLAVFRWRVMTTWRRAQRYSGRIGEPADLPGGLPLGTSGSLGVPTHLQSPPAGGGGPTGTRAVRRRHLSL